MMRSMFRIAFSFALALSLAFGVFSGIGTSLASAASSQPVAASGYNPEGATPTGVGYCYPSGYNRNGWRCGWRLAMAPYNLGDYYNRCYNYNYYGNYGYNNYNNCGYNYGYNYGNYGYGGYGYGGYYNWVPPNGDYGGRPRFGGWYYNNPCTTYYNPYCY
jgi:hypothetical protein